MGICIHVSVQAMVRAARNLYSNTKQVRSSEVRSYWLAFIAGAKELFKGKRLTSAALTPLEPAGDS
jgi:hypothetical protein